MSLSWQTLSPLLYTECSPWIVPMSIMSMPTCVAQTDGPAKFCYTHQRPNKCRSIIGVHVLYCHIVPWTVSVETFICSPYMHISHRYRCKSEHLFFAAMHTVQNVCMFSKCACNVCLSFVAWLYVSTCTGIHKYAWLALAKHAWLALAKHAWLPETSFSLHVPICSNSLTG